MSILISVLVPTTVALVVTAISLGLWRRRRSATDARVAIAAAAVLVIWAAAVGVLAYQGAFRAAPGDVPPAIGVALAFALAVFVSALLASASLRRLVGSQADLTRLHVWRLIGLVFVLLSVWHRLPALFALPAGLGDAAIGATAPWMARHAETLPARRFVVWHALGLADLIMAVALGVTTNTGVTQIFHTVPTSEAMTLFPLALVPAFLVPLAATLHGLSLGRIVASRVQSRNTMIGSTRPAAIAGK